MGRDQHPVPITLKHERHKPRVDCITLEQGENTSFSADPAHLLDGRDVEVLGELVGKGKQGVRAKGEIERAVLEGQRRQHLGAVASCFQTLRKMVEEAPHRRHSHLTQSLRRFDLVPQESLLVGFHVGHVLVERGTNALRNVARREIVLGSHSTTRCLRADASALKLAGPPAQSRILPERSVAVRQNMRTYSA